MRVMLACLVVSLVGAGAAMGASLRELADARGIHIGAAVAVQPFRNEPVYTEVLAREFNMIVGENAFKWGEIHRYRDDFNFRQTDAMVDFAETNGMAVRGHALVWHNQNPPWLEGALTDRETAIEVLRHHIEGVVGHYRGRVASWDVVNEAFEDSGELRDTLWLRAIGPDYIALAFQFAHAADPDAALYYNDYNAEGLGPKSDAVYALVKQLKTDGVPIHGVGWQMHLTGGQTIGPEFRANGERLAELGLDVMITELDVRVPVGRAGVSGMMRTLQADVYRDVVTLCVELPNCRAVLTWGFTDRHSWVPGFFTGEGAALPFDEDYQPKSAYEAMREALTTP